MKLKIWTIILLFLSFKILYSQVIPETWELPVDNVRSVEPALAINTHLWNYKFSDKI